MQRVHSMTVTRERRGEERRAGEGRGGEREGGMEGGRYICDSNF